MFCPLDTIVVEAGLSSLMLADLKIGTIEIDVERG